MVLIRYLFMVLVSIFISKTIIISEHHLSTIITFVLVYIHIYIVRVLCFYYLCMHIANDTYYARTYLRLQHFVSALQCRVKKV